MPKILIVSDHLLMAGAERLIYEIVTFSRANHIEPTILIVNNYSIEYYDQVYREMKVTVIRTRLNDIRALRSPVNIIRAIYWRLKLRYRSKETYQSIQVIGLYNADKILDIVRHPNRFFWHVNNAIQYFEEIYPFPPVIFENEADTVICINPYQAEELDAQYGNDNIRSKIKLFKLFAASYDTTERSQQDQRG